MSASVDHELNFQGSFALNSNFELTRWPYK